MFVNGAGQGQTLNTRIFLTVWDGGVIDTYDMSNFAENALIDLTPGGFSRFSSGQLAYRQGGTAKVNGNVYNAFQYKGDARSLIENAVGGSGNDRIFGNQTDNALKAMVGMMRSMEAWATTRSSAGTGMTSSSATPVRTGWTVARAGIR